MKRLLTLLLAALMLFSFAACGGNSNDTAENKDENNKPQASTPAKEEPEDKEEPIPEVSEEPEVTLPVEEDDTLLTPASILEKIITDFTTTTDSFQQKLEETIKAVGTTYEEYMENKGLIDEWADLVFRESNALFTRTREKSIAYFKLIASDPKHEDYDFCSKSLDDYYEAVYCDAMDLYYDTLYVKAMDTIYDQYYCGIMDAAYDIVDFDEWYEASDECFNVWFNTSSKIYDFWFDESSYVYDLWFAISSELSWTDNYDIDAIIAEFESTSENADNADVSAEPEVTPSPEPVLTPEPSTEPEPAPDGGIRPEFKAAMDSYEAFYDEYCEFMEEYMADPTNLKLLAKYPEMLSKLSEMDKAFDEWDDGDLSNEELAYYLEVTNRVTQKLLKVA